VEGVGVGCGGDGVVPVTVFENGPRKLTLTPRMRNEYVVPGAETKVTE
jgi:hypothetical protein